MIISFNTGKEIKNTEGKEQKDNCFSNRQVHTCSICGKTGFWDDNWRWYGSWKEIDDGKNPIKICSKECAIKSKLPMHDWE